MTGRQASGPRCVALVGPYLGGKTTLLESLLAACGAIPRRGSIKDGTTVGDSAPAARARQMSVEMNIAHATFMDEAWTFVDCPGSIEFAHEAHAALMVADAAVVVTPPEAERAAMLGPVLKFLDDHAIPHVLFVNKIDVATTRLRDLLAAFQAVSTRPLALRQVPIRQGDTITGYVDLVSERAYRYHPGQPSDLIQLPADVKAREQEARGSLLETLADYDDKLLEQLLEDTAPPADVIYADLAKTFADDKLVPVLIGSAERDYGVRRLLKFLRHEVPSCAATAARLGLSPGDEPLAQIFKTRYVPHAGKLSFARIWRGAIADGATLGDGVHHARLASIGRPLGAQTSKLAKAEAGDVVALGKLEGLATGSWITPAARPPAELPAWPDAPKPLFSLAVNAEKRGDDVKLSGALHHLVEEDPSLVVEHDADTHELLLWGQGEVHVSIAADRLRTQHHVAVVTHPPRVPYKETIRKSVDQHARHKRQSGGHGQFADVTIKIEPLPRGGGFAFEDKIVGGAVPRNFIPAVEEGVRDFLKRGPLGFPVVDVKVTLHDGQYHDVDSSDMAFKTAGALGMREGMPKCDPVLLEPICKVAIDVPQEFTSNVQRILSSRRGRILGFDARAGWPGWDEVQAYLPQAEMHDLIVELRSVTMGVGGFDWRFDHLTEVTGKLADKIVAAANGDGKVPA
ncbi:MAG: elongation factor G [Alphaproteobacteria bacterium]|nr:elongation factor G [Alphaproteobacteria bacterium]